MTECQKQVSLFNLSGKSVKVEFSGGMLTSDAGVALLAMADKKRDLINRIATRFHDERVLGRSTHTVEALLRQRIFQIALGYEDCNDANELRADPALKMACGRLPQSGDDLGSQPTLSRFENCVGWDTLLKLHDLMLDLCLERLIDRFGGKLPRRLILDLDSTCDPTHGQQEFTFFNAHYDTHMYHPILVTVDKELLGVCLRPGNVGAAAGVLNWLPHVIARIRAIRPDCRIRIRGDAGFASPEMYEFCDAQDLEFIIGLGTNKVLVEQSILLQAKAMVGFQQTGRPQKRYSSFDYQAGTWNKKRHVVVKSEINTLGTNVRFVVHNLRGKLSPKSVYSEDYCGRGRMENNIKDLKNALRADRLSCSRFEANAFRLLLHGFAYILMSEVRDTQAGTELDVAQFDTLRLKLLKVAALIEETARHVWVRVCKSFPRKAEFTRALESLSPA